MNGDDDVFADALALPVSERVAFLAAACQGDDAQRGRIEALLRGHDRAEEILNAPLSPRVGTVAEEKIGDLIGRYKLLQKIGEGGMGVVYLAGQEEPVRRRVAIKIIKLGMDTKSVIARFEAERQALALMDHPNIARVFDGGATDTGRPYFVMELVRGVRITQYCDEAGLSTRDRLELFIQVCQAIQHAHQKGIIHRDIKPSNILVTVNDGVAVPKVIDFGIAKATEGRLTDTTLVTQFDALMGTPSYMSPEQTVMTSVDVDTRSDIYSLGALLYEMLAGRTPFDAKELLASGLDEMRKTVRDKEPVRPSTRLATLQGEEQMTTAKRRSTDTSKLLSELQGDLDWIVMKCLEKDRVRRYQTANGLSADLKRHLNDEAVTARPPSRAYLLQKLIRRHRLAFTATAAIAVVLMLGAVVSTWQAVRATRAERVAERGEQEQTRLRATESNLRKHAEAQSLASRRQAYGSDMHRVQQALANDDFSLAREMLYRQRPRPGESDLRGWEWRYLWQFCQSESTTDLSIKLAVISVSSDGTWLATADSREVKVWNLRTFESVIVPLPAEAEFPRISFSPREPLLAVSWPVVSAPEGRKGRVRLWNVAAQLTVADLTVDDVIGRSFFAADGQSLLLWGSDGAGSVWRIPSGEFVKRSAARVGLGRIRSMPPAMTDDLQLIADWENRTLRLVEFDTGIERWRVPPPGIGIHRLALSRDGKLLATSHVHIDPVTNLWKDERGFISLREVETGRELRRLEGHRGVVAAIMFWPDGKTLATGGQDQTIRIWDVNTGKLLRVLHGHTGDVTQIVLLPDQTTLVSSSSSDGTVRVWDTTATRLPAHINHVEPRLRPSSSWRFDADSQSIVVIDAAGNLQRFGGRDFRQQSQLASSMFGQGNALFATDAPLVAYADPKGVVQIWNWESASLVREFRTPPGELQAFRDGGTKLLLACDSADIALRGLYEWDVATGAKTRFWPRTAAAGDYVVSSDGNQCLVRPLGPMFVLFAFSPSVRSNPEGCSLIDLVSGVERKLDGVTAGDDLASFSPDGRFFAAPLGLTATIWETKTFQPVKTLTGFLRRGEGTLFSPDGRRLVVATAGDTIRVWDTDAWEQVFTLNRPGAVFTSIAFSPDGNVLGAMNVFGELNLWRAPSWAEIEAAEKVGLGK